MGFEKKEYDVRVRTITKIEREKEDGSIVTHRLVARDKEGLNEIVIVSASPFKGLTAKSGVLHIVVQNSQLRIDHFEKEEKEEEES